MACGHGMLGRKAVGRLGLRGVRHEGKVPLGQAQGPGSWFRTGSCVWQLEVGLWNTSSATQNQALQDLS